MGIRKASGGRLQAGSTFTLDLSGVASRQLMSAWDANWISEYEEYFDDYEMQVDTGNGGQCGVWTGSGNPSPTPTVDRDVSNFIAAGPAAGLPVRVRLKIIWGGDEGPWASLCHSGDTDTQRTNYQVALFGNALTIYKFWGPNPSSDFAEVASSAYSPTPGTTYWIYITETRVGNAIDGNVTIEGELLSEALSSLATVSVSDTGSLAGEALIESTNKRGFGAFMPMDGTGTKFLECIIEPAP